MPVWRDLFLQSEPVAESKLTVRAAKQALFAFFRNGVIVTIDNMLNAAGKATILMVEDDENDVFLFEQEFIRLMDRLRVRRVKDGVEAKDYMQGVGAYANREKYPFPDVILLDLKLPRISGLEFLAWLRSALHGNDQLTPVIVLSSSNLEADVNRARAAGVSAFLTKPALWDVVLEQFTRLGIYLAEPVEPPPTSSPELPAVAAL